MFRQFRIWRKQRKAESLQHQLQEERLNNRIRRAKIDLAKEKERSVNLERQVTYQEDKLPTNDTKGEK